MSDFHFLRPLWFLAFAVLIPLCLFALRGRGQQHSPWNRVCDSHLLPFILSPNKSSGRDHSALLLCLIASLCIVALAGPTWQTYPSAVLHQRSSLVVLLDLSRSMNAQDIAPSRLDRAKFKIRDLLKARTEGQTALVVFAAEPFVVTPLTEDVETIALQLEALLPEVMPAQGTNHEVAIEQGVELLRGAGESSGQLLILTDAVPAPDTAKLIRELGKEGIKTSIIALGTEAGSPIPSAGGYLKDNRGNIVLSRLNMNDMRAFGASSDARIIQLSHDDQDMRQLLSLMEGSAKAEKDDGDRTFEQWMDMGPWLLPPVLVLGALLFRRGAFGLLLALLCLSPQRAQAADVSTLMNSPTREAARQLRSGQQADPELFNNEQWKAGALYRSGKFDEAAGLYAGKEDSDSLYNLGNSLAKLGKLPEAVQAYRNALEQDPKNEDARHNLDLVEKALQQDQEPQNSNDKGDQQQDGDKQDGEEKDASEEKKPQDKQSGPPDEPSETPESAQEEVPSQPDETDEPAEEDPRLRPLSRVPDDPGGLLRRKFLLQSERREQKQTLSDEPW